MYIPIKTLWKRGDTLPENAQLDFGKGRARMTFGGKFLPLGWAYRQYFGDAKHYDLDESFNAAGYQGVIERVGLNEDSSVYFIIHITRVPNPGDPAPDVIPLVAIVGALAAIGIGIIVIAMLSKVEAILKLPTAYLIGGTVFLVTLGAPAMLKKSRGS